MGATSEEVMEKILANAKKHTDAQVTVKDWGVIKFVDGHLMADTTVTITVGDNITYTGVLTSYIKEENSEIKSIKVVSDNRNVKDIPVQEELVQDSGTLANVINLYGLKLEVTLNDGTKQILNGEAGAKLTGAGSENIVVDFTSYKMNNNKVGTYAINFYAKDNYDVSASVNIRVYRDDVRIDKSDLGIKYDLKTVKSADTSMVSNGEVYDDRAFVKTYKAGDTNLIVEDIYGNKITVPVTVLSNGKIKFNCC